MKIEDMSTRQLRRALEATRKILPPDDLYEALVLSRELKHRNWERKRRLDRLKQQDPTRQDET